MEASGRYNFVLKTLKHAGKILLEKKVENFSVEKKNDSERDLVTSVDVMVNDFISSKIGEVYPGEKIYSEEISGGEVFKVEDSFWCIDPIDGTSNFIKSIPHYAVCISFFSNGQIVCGGAFNPITNELFSVNLGQGAFVNGAQVTTSDCFQLEKSTIILHPGRENNLRKWAVNVYEKIIFTVKTFKCLGSSALDFCFVGCGRADICVYSQVSVFDILFAMSFILEAGGIVTDENYNEIKLSFDKQKVFAFANKKIMENFKKLGV